LPSTAGRELTRKSHRNELHRIHATLRRDLFQSLSHVVFGGQLERLTARDWQVLPPSSRKALQKTTSKRDFGEVGDAIVQVLAGAPFELRVIEIHAAVEDLLGEPVSRSSVKNYLARGCDRRKTLLFERVSRGRYCLLR
jgi:hypothetical protein